MTKLHKEIAMRLLECTQDEEFTDQATIKVSNYLICTRAQWILTLFC